MPAANTPGVVMIVIVATILQYYCCCSAANAPTLPNANLANYAAIPPYFPATISIIYSNLSKYPSQCAAATATGMIAATASATNTITALQPNKPADIPTKKAEQHSIIHSIARLKQPTYLE